MRMQQSTNAILMVRPTSFGFDEATAVSNKFQIKSSLSQGEVQRRANSEFRQAVDLLVQHDITVIVFEDRATPPKPNAVFPNNWFSTWPDGRVVLYPMATESRRMERNLTLLGAMSDYFAVSEIVDLTQSERDNKFLESTGVLVFDHAHKIVYGCPSP